MFTLFAIVFFLIGLALFGIGLMGEYVGRIYAAGARAPALSGRGGAGAPGRPRRPIAFEAASGPAVTRAVVFAYSEVGVRCLRELLAQGMRVPTRLHARGRPGEKHWFGSVEELAAGARHPGRDAGRSERARNGIAEVRRVRPDFLFSFYYRSHAGRSLAGAAALRRAEHAWIAAAQVSRPRAGELGNRQRRDGRRARACTTWWKSPMPALWWISNRSAYWRTRRRWRYP